MDKIAHEENFDFAANNAGVPSLTLRMTLSSICPKKHLTQSGGGLRQWGYFFWSGFSQKLDFGQKRQTNHWLRVLLKRLIIILTRLAKEQTKDFPEKENHYDLVRK
ncbi:MAG: hypothetical protein MUE30_18785, partial [Spirosomaceae bacterium]|nr:hypothetical protein [Spirosomataceae bacterium]